MSDQQKEQERLRRIAQRQIEARDPTKKQRKMHGEISSRSKQKRASENFIKDSAKAVPYSIKAMLAGALVGLILVIVVPLFWEHELASAVGVLSIPVLMVIGFMLGASFDWRDKMRDYMRK